MSSIEYESYSEGQSDETSETTGYSDQPHTEFVSEAVSQLEAFLQEHSSEIPSLMKFMNQLATNESIELTDQEHREFLPMLGALLPTIAKVAAPAIASVGGSLVKKVFSGVASAAKTRPPTPATRPSSRAGSLTLNGRNYVIYASR